MTMSNLLTSMGSWSHENGSLCWLAGDPESPDLMMRAVGYNYAGLASRRRAFPSRYSVIGRFVSLLCRESIERKRRVGSSQSQVDLAYAFIYALTLVHNLKLHNLDHPVSLCQPKYTSRLVCGRPWIRFLDHLFGDLVRESLVQLQIEIFTCSGQNFLDASSAGYFYCDFYTHEHRFTEWAAGWGI